MRTIPRIAVEHIVVIYTVNPADNPDVGFPMDIVEVAVIDSRRCIRLDAAVGYSNGSVVPGSVADPVRERDPGKAKSLCRVKRDL